MKRSIDATWFVLIPVVLAAGLFEVHNLDVFLHARTGEWIVEHREVPTTNVLSRLHHDYPSVHDKWAFQVLTHGLLDGVGPGAVIAVRLVLLALLAWLVVSCARRLGASREWALLVVLLAWLAARARFMFRPDLVSLVLLAAFVRALLTVRWEDPRARGVRRAAWALLGLQVIWVNTHGYFVQGPIVVAAVAIGHAFRGREGRAAARRLGLLFLGLSAACFVSPNGWRGAFHPIAILRDLHAHEDFYTATIGEFLPTFAFDPRQPYDRIAYVVVGALGFVGLAGAALRRRARTATSDGVPHTVSLPVWSWPAVGVAVVLAAQSLGLRRNMAPFALGVAPIAAASLTVATVSWRGLRVGIGVASWILAATLVLGETTDAISVHDGSVRRSGVGLSSLAYPWEGIDFIAEHLPESSVFTAFSFGSTFTGLRWPAQVAATNGNTHGYPTAYLIEVTSAISGRDPTAFDRIVERDGHDVALLRTVNPLSAALFARSDWRLVCVGVVEAVYVRVDAVSPTWLGEHDLEAAVARGELARWPDTPAPRRRLVDRAWRPIAEVDQATLLLAAAGQLAGMSVRAAEAPAVLEAALARATRATERRPDDGEALAVQGWILRVAGRDGEAWASLRRSLEVGGHTLVPQVRRLLDDLDGDS